MQNETHYAAPSGLCAYNTGLTPCIHGMVSNAVEGYCVMVQLFPNMKYYEETQMELVLSPALRSKRAIGEATILLSSLICLG